MIENTGNVLLTIGTVLIFFAALSVVRFSDVYSRANAFVKLACLGIFCLMLGVLTLTGFSATGLKAAILFVLAIATLPAGIQMLLKASVSSGRQINEGEKTDEISQIKRD